MKNQPQITVIVVKPNQKPYVSQIDTTLESMQSIVGGYIEELMPFDDEVALVCNTNGKLENLELNRALYDDKQELYDIISGTFFICSAPFDSEYYQSLSPEMIEKYLDNYKCPEYFLRTPSGISVLHHAPSSPNHER